MIYILWGEDEFSLSETLNKIKKKLGDKSLMEINTTVLDGQAVTLNELMQFCESVPFLADKRLVIINGLLTRFNIRERPAAAKKSAAATKDDYKPLADCILRLPDSTVLVLVDTRIESANPLFKTIAPKATVHSFSVKRGRELGQWIQEHVVAEGGRISPGAGKLLAEIGGGNLRNLTNEIKKLVLFTAGRPITENDVKAVVSEAQEFRVFALIDAVFESKAGFAEQIVQQLLDKGVAPSHLMTMVSRQVRMLIQTRELKEQKKSASEIREKLGITLEFILRKMLEQVDRYSMEQLKHIYRKLLETDLAIKTGKYDEELALNLLVAELCERNRL